MTRVLQSATDIADAVLERVGRDVVLGLPVGIGKAVHVADALYERALADPGISLTIFSGLTLTPPTGRSDLERRFLEPLTERLYADWPTPAYAPAIHDGSLPPNIRVHEFYLRPGAYLGNALVQRNYASINYSHVAAALVELGVNVIAQLVAPHPEHPDRFSLSSNPEVTLDLLPHMDALRAQGRAALVAQVNTALPYMDGPAELGRERFDFVLDARDCDFPPFALPNRPVSAADYATGMHVASLIPDGGTLQVGIGSLSDAVAHCLYVRDRHPDVFRDVLAMLPGGSDSARRAALPVETAPFRDGLYAATELLSDAMYSLFERGIVRRAADSDDPTVIHAGFFLGSSRFYQALRELPDGRRRLLRMSPISFVNTLFDDENRKRAQRRHARFVNETMMVTLLGAAVSDALEDGRVVSGVGGQFDFVHMGLSLENAHSILMLRARRMHDGRPQSNVRWQYGHATVPRHHRDVFVSEYGIAATRALADEDVVAALLGIADADFHDELAAKAIAAGKLAPGFAVDADARRNTPAEVERVFQGASVREHFPPFPLGSELSSSEQSLAVALSWLKDRAARPTLLLKTAAAALLHGDGADPADAAAIDRMGYADARGLRARLTRRLLRYALQRTRQ